MLARTRPELPRGAGVPYRSGWSVAGQEDVQDPLSYTRPQLGRREGLLTDPTPHSSDMNRSEPSEGRVMLPLSAPRALLWALLALPPVWLLARWMGGAFTYGDVVRWSGFWAALLLFPTTLITPMDRLFPRAPGLGWLRQRRHDFGVACVTYAVLHTTAYAIGKGSLGVILRDARQPWLVAGWATLVIFLLFAAARVHAAQAGLRPSWTPRHRVIYLGATLVVLHWAFSAFDPLTDQVQTALRVYGYYSGPIDGIIGLRSREALSRMQRDHGLPVTGGITPDVLDVLGIIPN